VKKENVNVNVIAAHMLCYVVADKSEHTDIVDLAKRQGCCLQEQGQER